MELTVLGTSGTWPGPGGATSGFLVQHDGFNLWVDAGTGTFSRLQQHIAVADIHAVLVTHAHPDHFVDLYSCFYARHYGGLGTDSPRLDAQGNSVRGQLLTRRLAEQLGLNIFTSDPALPLASPPE